MKRKRLNIYTKSMKLKAIPFGRFKSRNLIWNFSWNFFEKYSNYNKKISYLNGIFSP